MFVLFSPFTTNIQPAIVEEGVVPVTEMPVERAVKPEAQMTPQLIDTTTAVVDPRKVTVAGVGIRPQGVPASLPISFKVDTREAGQSDLDVVVTVS